jgi:hypothetical protein
VLPETVRLVVDAFPRLDWPETVKIPDVVRLVVDALPSDDVPDVSVEKTPVVKVGLGVIPIVDVEEKTTFDPAVKYDIGDS